uniref:Uncharacterized protein n=1 Tax=Mesocestoides corti TaxID=53468 RepID=A0A5K3ERG6_MESCO
MRLHLQTGTSGYITHSLLQTQRYKSQVTTHVACELHGEKMPSIWWREATPSPTWQNADHQYQATLQVGQHVGSEDTEEEPTSTSTSASPDKDHHEHRRANLQLGELVADEHTLVGEPPLKSTNSQAEKHYFGCDPRILDSKSAFLGGLPLAIMYLRGEGNEQPFPPPTSTCLHPPHHHHHRMQARGAFVAWGGHVKRGCHRNFLMHQSTDRQRLRQQYHHHHHRHQQQWQRNRIHQAELVTPTTSRLRVNEGGLVSPLHRDLKRWHATKADLLSHMALID